MIDLIGSHGKSIAGKTLKELATSNKTLAILYEDFSQRIGREFADGITIKSTRQGIELVSKDFPNSAIKITNNIISGKGGSLANSGQVLFRRAGVRELYNQPMFPVNVPEAEAVE